MNDQPRFLSSAVEVFPNVQIDPSCVIGHGSVLGIPSIDNGFVSGGSRTVIGPECLVGCFCVIESGAYLGARVKVDHYVRVGPGTTIGNDTLLLYGTRIHCDVRIGARCRISGNCPDRTIIEDDVTHFGRLHHDYSAPQEEWDQNEEPSAHIGRRSVIGAGAILVGGIRIGQDCYIAAGEIVRNSVPDRCVVYKGKVISGADWRGRLASTGFFERG
jgi:UDP-3-O-[3-hydroxymyristoyl] glucosamine N-acyltransferase